MSDLISREALLKETEKLKRKCLGNCSLAQGIVISFENIITMQPTVEAVPVVHGEWIKINNRPKTYIRRCSVCGRDSYTCFSEKDYDYCPWCRADMRKKV